MTYSLNTLNNRARRRRRAAAGVGRFAHEIALVLGLVALVFWLLALVSYSAQDAGVLHFRHRRRHPQLGRAPGRLAGRRELFPAGLFRLVVRRRGRAGLARDAGALDASGEEPSRRAGAVCRARAWPSGSGWPCCCARARRSNGRACTASKRACPTTPAARWATWSGPGASSGWASPARAWCSWRWSCSAPRVVFRFSWGHVAERLGACIDGLVEARREKREMAQDLAFGQQAARAARGNPDRGAHRDRGAPSDAGADRAGAGRGAQERAGAPRNGRSRCSPKCPIRKLPQVDLLDGAADAAGNGVARNAGDDQPADREEAQGLRRRGARGAGPARPGDHALRDRARHRRQGLADRRPGQGPGALAQPGVDPRGRDHPGQELHGAGTAQRQAPVDPAVRDPGLAGLQRGQVAC